MMKLAINKTKPSMLRSNSGFIIADFLFSFVLVIGIGIVIFGLTFSLATIEVAQYIVWSSARNFAAGNVSESAASNQATLKFNNLSQQFPLLTGQGATGSAWFTLDEYKVGNLARIDQDLSAKIAVDLPNRDPNNEERQPWIGASAKIYLKLFAGLQIPFLGKIATDTSTFAFPVRAFIIRSPSQAECSAFYNFDNRFVKGIKPSNQFLQMTSATMVSPPTEGEQREAYVNQEDNGC